MKGKINELEFINTLCHMSKDRLLIIAQKFTEVTFVPINIEQDRIEVLDTLFAVYYKDIIKLHKNSLSQPDHIWTFDFNVHHSCPFTENSRFKLAYAIIADNFGFGNKITRDKAIEKIEDVYIKRNKIVDGAKIMSRVLFQLNHIFPKFGDFGGNVERGIFVLNEVEKWEKGVPLFKGD